MRGGSTVVLAHSLGTAADTVPGFLWLGVVHMLAGWDHLLFIGGVVLLAGRPRRAATMVSVFAAGHSITLFTATVAQWRVSPALVDGVIALSVVVVGVIAFRGRPRDWTVFAAMVGGFGLVHGLGLATRLQALGLPADGTIARVLAFNLGVELGQVVVVAVAYAAGLAIRHRVCWPALPRVAAGTLVVGGLAAAALVPLTATGELPFAAGRSTLCTVYDHPAGYPTGTAAPDSVIVRYQPTLTADQLTRLRDVIHDVGAQRMAAEPAAAQDLTVTASTAERSLRCTAFDDDALRHFAADWFDNRASRPGR
jgi:hydrogenase/urease accessory protein HupE